MRRKSSLLFFALFFGFTLIYLLGCTSTTIPNIDDLQIVANDAFDVPIGEYTVPYTIDHFNEYVSEYGLVVSISALDQFGNPVETTQNVISIIAGRIYTVKITASINGEVSKEKIITVTAVEKVIVSIAVTTNPVRTSYFEGEIFSPEGMVVTATYSDASTVVVQDITFPTASLGLSDTVLLITHTASGQTTTVLVSVSPLSQAVWTVTFQSNGGELIGGTEVQSIHHGESAIAPVYEKKGYLFNGFDTAYDSVTSHLTVTAQWIDMTQGTLGLDFELNGTNAYAVVGYWGTSSEVYVPSMHNGLPVNRIGNSAFLNNTTMQILHLPASVVFLGIDPFSGAVNLEAIEISSDNLQFSSIDGIVYDKLQTTLIRCPQGKFGELTIPEGITSIGYGALMNCRLLTDIFFPDSLFEIASLALTNTQWLDDQPDGLVYAGNVAFKYIGTMPSGTSITLAAGTLGIAAEAFAFQDHLISIQLPNSMIVIGNQAFLGCDGLTEIIIPNSVKSIGTGAFELCSNLLNLYVSTALEQVGVRAFKDTLWLLNQPDGVVYLSHIVYTYKGVMPENTVLQLLPGTIGIADYAFYTMDGMTNLVSIGLPDTLTTIGEGAFSGCSGLTMIFIPDNVESIGSMAFYNTVLDIYAEAVSEPATWNQWWNLTQRPVFWNCMSGSYPLDFSFNSMEGSAIDPINAVFLSVLPTPVRTGYTFLGWYEQLNYSGIPVTAPYYPESKADTTLYAKWELSVYHVTFIIDGWTKTGGGDAIQSVHYGDSIANPPLISKSGYSFVAWHVDLSFITESIHVIPVWARLVVDTTLVTPDGVWVSAESALSGCAIEIDFGTGTFVPFINGSQKWLAVNTALLARVSYQGAGWVALPPLVISNIDSTRPSKPEILFYHQPDGQLRVTIVGGKDTGSGVLRHEYQIGASEIWIPFTSASLEITVPNHTLIRARTIDLGMNLSIMIERYLRVDTVMLENQSNALIDRFVVTEIISPNGALTTTNIALKGSFWTDQSSYQEFISYSTGDNYPGCGVKAAQIFMEWFGESHSMSWINDEVETTDFGKYIEWLTENTWADPSVFTTPAQLRSGLQALINANFDNYEVIRRSPNSSAEAIAMIESSLADGFPVAILVDDGGHWQIISQSIVIRNDEGEIISATFLTHDDRGDAYRTWSELDFFFEDNWLAEVARAMDYTSYVDTLITIRYEIPVQTENWSVGWSSAEFFTVGANAYVFLSKTDGTVHINQMNANGTIGSLVQSYSWSDGWDNVSFYTENNETYLVLYKSSNQLLHIRKMNLDGSIGTLTTETNFPDTAYPNISILNAVMIDGVYYLDAAAFHGSGDSAVNRLYDLSDGGVLGEEISHKIRSLTYAFSNATIFEAYGKTYVINSDSGTGYVEIISISDSLTFGDKIASYHWSDGWTQVIPYTINGETFLLISKSGDLGSLGMNADPDGLMRIMRINEDGTIGVQIDSSYWETTGIFVMAFGYSVIRIYQNASGETFLFTLRSFDGSMRIFQMNDDGTIKSALS